MTEQAYEYAVMHYQYPDKPHRAPYSARAVADSWVAEGFKSGVFYAVRRPTGEWERVRD